MREYPIRVPGNDSFILTKSLTFGILLICSQIETDKEDAEQLALAAPKVQSYLEGRQIRKVIVVPKRLVNIVCG